MSRLSKKDTNPKQTVGSKLVNITNVSLPVIAELSLGMTEGAYKYGRHNYRVAGVLASTYVAAAFRHIAKYWEGEDFDFESVVNLHHVTKAMSSLAVLRDAMIQAQKPGNEHLYVDDRPPASPDGWMTNLNGAAAELLSYMHSNLDGGVVPPYTQKELEAEKLNEAMASAGPSTPGV